MKTFIVIIALVLLAASQGESKRHPRYKQHMIRFNKDYSNKTADFVARRQNNFFQNLDKIEKFNNRTGEFQNAAPGMKLAINKFSDRNPENFVKDYCGLRLPPDARSLPQAINLNINMYAPVKASVDYRNYFQPIRTQGQCGCCWAYATASILEAHITKQTRVSQMLSRQSLVDCSPVDFGCNGGWPGATLKWLYSTGGNKLPLDANYPFVSEIYQNKVACKTGVPTVPLNIKYFFTVQVKSEDILLRIVSNIGPVAIAMYVGTNGIFQNYGGGIHYDPVAPSGYECDKVNHAMVVVGYGSDGPGQDYWLVRNSWGTTWGEQGYVRMARNRNNNANIACHAFGLVPDTPY